MSNSFRRTALRVLETTGLIGPVFRLKQRWQASQAADHPDSAGERPPAFLRLLVSGSTDVGTFDHLTERHADTFLSLAGRHGFAIDQEPRVLDFGCGCGRLARVVAPQIEKRGGAFFGSDIEPQHIAWCQDNLPGTYMTNPLRPPVDLPAGSLDLIYAHSVVTHLSRPTIALWFEEFARLLRPDGVAVVTFHDEGMAPEGLKDELARTGFALSTRSLEGSVYMATYTTRAFLRTLAEPWLEVPEIVPSDGLGHQAIAVLRRA